MSLTVVRQRSHDRSDACFDEPTQHVAVSSIDITHPTIVDVRTFDINGWTFVTTDGIGIGSRQSEGIDAVSLKTGHQVLVDQSAIHHRDNLKHITVSNATPIDHLGLYAQAFSHFGGFASAAMNQHLAALDGREVF